MKRTFTANISGTIFHIEEDAYERLQQYFQGIRRQLEGAAGHQEIMADVEARVAELFQERLQGREAVGMADVEHVVERLGQPEDFGEGAGAAEGQAEKAAEEAPRGYKRLFRDPDDKWVGGVLSGLAAYIGMDPIWLRVIMVVLILLGKGTPILLYLLLWILVPVAGSAADRLRMHGEPITVGNLKRAFEQGGRRVAADVHEMGRNWKGEGRRSMAQAAGIVGRIIGAGVVLLGVILLLGLVSAVVSGSFGLWNDAWSADDLGPLDWADLLFESRAMALWTGAGLLLLCLIPILGLLLGGFRLLLGTRTPAWLGWSLGLLWIMAWVPALIGGLGLAREFNRRGAVQEEVILQSPPAGTLYIDTLAQGSDWASWPAVDDEDGDGLPVRIEGETITARWARMDVEPSPDSLFRLVVERKASGRGMKQAQARAQGIEAGYRQEGEVLRASPLLRFPRDQKLRVQEARLILQVPVGKAVFFRPGAGILLGDADNIQGTPERDMIGRSWRMTPRGLEEGGPKEQGIEPPASGEGPVGIMSHLPDAALPAHGIRLPSLLAFFRLAF